MTRSMRGGVLALWAISAGPGCPEATECGDLGPPSMQLGEGAEAFSAVEAGHAYEPESGSQGGQHIWLALRLQGMHPGAYKLTGEDLPGPDVDVEIFSGDELWTEANPPAVPVAGYSVGDRIDMAGIRVVLSQGYYYYSTTSTDTDVDTDFTMQVRVEDSCGQELDQTIPMSFR